MSSITKDNEKWTTFACKFVDEIINSVPIERLPWIEKGEIDMEGWLNTFYRGLKEN